MPASVPLYHDVRRQVDRSCPALAPAAAERLALLVTGVVAARSCVLAAVAAELDALALTAAVWAESIERRLRRALDDRRLTAESCYAPLLARAVDWRGAADEAGRIVLIADESSLRDRVHLFRLSLPYRGGSLPVAWAVWEQNAPLPPGAYWAHVDAALAAAAAALPAGATVVVLADRAYAVPAFLDRVAARGWHWAVRMPTGGSHRFRPERGAEAGVAELAAARLGRPGARWRARGHLFKDAGWRPARLVGVWGAGAGEPLVVATDLPADWAVVALYGRRFWIEAGFRADKSRGWGWEQSQVRGVARHAVLLLALAWATLAVLCAGAAEAGRRLRHLAARPARAHAAVPQPAGESLFVLGLRRVRHWLAPTRRRWRWKLPDPAGPAWTAEWRAAQARRLVFGAPVRS